MKIQIWFILILLGLSIWLGYDKITGQKTDLSFYVNQIAELSQIVSDLQVTCKK